MVPPAISSLYVVLVCSIFAAVSETAGDHKRNDIITGKTNIIRNEDILENFPTKMRTHRTNFNFKYTINNDNYITRNNINNNFVNIINYDYMNENNFKIKNVRSDMRQYNASEGDKIIHRRKRQESDEAICDNFVYFHGREFLSTPVNKKDKDTSDKLTYAPKITCETIIDVTGFEGNNIIKLNFVDVFHIEEHPTCEYDYLEIRDGRYGYSKLVNRYCGESFPPTVTSTGPYLWLRFRSDENIEYEGFRISVGVEPSNRIMLMHLVSPSVYFNWERRICNVAALPMIQSVVRLETHFLYITTILPCNLNESAQTHGVIDTARIPDDCKSQATTKGSLDVLWSIETKEDHKIYLNFTTFQLEKPNECNENYVEVFDAKTDMDSRLELFCGSVATSVTTKGNKLYVHLFATSRALKTRFNSTYTGFRTLELTKDGKYEKCDENDEFDCEDNTCIDKGLKCDDVAHCRLKADEDHELCKTTHETLKDKPHILIILVIFSLILSGMSFVFLFKCIRKLVQDHKIIKEHIRQSCEDRLDSLDVRKLHRGSEPRASLERDNHTNEMFKKQRSLSHHKERPTSIDSDFIQETHLDIEVDSWRRDIESVPIETENVRIEQNGGNRRSDISKKEQSMRRGSKRERDQVKEKKEIRDVSVGAPDTKESSCQTRESLFQAGTASSEGTESGSGGRAFSTFGYSGATLVRPSPPAPPVLASEITLELLKDCPSQESKTKKIPDRRPMSNETTRSAPDVIIVSKPIR